MTEFQDLVQTFQMALKARGMYTGAHPRAQSALGSLTAQLAEWLADKPTIHIASSQHKLFLDGAPFVGKSLHLATMSRQLEEREISGLILARGVSADELAEVLEVLSLKPAKIEEAGGVAAIFARKDLPHVQLGQTVYKAVREGEGGEEDSGGASSGTAGGQPEPAAQPAGQAPSQAPTQTSGDASGQGSGQDSSQTTPQSPTPPPASMLETLTGQWRAELEQLPGRNLLEDTFEPAHLGFLGGTPLSFGMGDNFPPASEVEGLRQALLALPPDRLMAVVAGLDSLPAAHAGMRLAFQSLAAEAFTQAATALVVGEAPREAVRDALFKTLRMAPQQNPMLAALENELRARGAGPEQMAMIRELIGQLDWESQSMDEKLRRAKDQGVLLKLTLEQRLSFLRRLLDEGRIEGLLALVQQILDALGSEEVSQREVAAQTLPGVCRWMEDPGLPTEAEGLVVQGLTAHFCWEPLAHILRSSAEALGVVLAAQVNRGEPGHALALVRELAALCAFQEADQDWRVEALANLRESLARPSFLAKVGELLHTANPETMLSELIPYLEEVGLPAARFLVGLLGGEPDRRRRGRLLEAIRSLGDPALPAVYEGLDSPTWYLVRNTLNLVSDMGDAGALDRVRACLGHSDGRVQRAAVRALWKLGGPASVAPLLAAIPQADPETQAEIMFALVQVRAVQAIAPLAAFAVDRRNPEAIRVKAAETLGQIGDPRAIPVLVDIVRRKGRMITTAEPVQVRVAACKALLALDTPAAWEALCELVASEPWHRDRSALQQVVNSRRSP